MAGRTNLKPLTSSGHSSYCLGELGRELAGVDWLMGVELGSNCDERIEDPASVLATGSSLSDSQVALFSLVSRGTDDAASFLDADRSKTMPTRDGREGVCWCDEVLNLSLLRGCGGQGVESDAEKLVFRMLNVELADPAETTSDMSHASDICANACFTGCGVSTNGDFECLRLRRNMGRSVSENTSDDSSSELGSCSELE